jgi:hypothetical protein
LVISVVFSSVVVEVLVFQLVVKMVIGTDEIIVVEIVIVVGAPEI